MPRNADFETVQSATSTVTVTPAYFGAFVTAKVSIDGKGMRDGTLLLSHSEIAMLVQASEIGTAAWDIRQTA